MAWQVLTLFNHIDIYTVHNGSFTRRYTDVRVEMAGIQGAYLTEFEVTPQSSHSWTYTTNAAPPKDMDSFYGIPKGNLTYNFGEIVEEFNLEVGDSVVYGHHELFGLPRNLFGFKLQSKSGNLFSAYMIFYYNSGWNSLNGSLSTFCGKDANNRFHHTYVSIVANENGQAMNAIWLHDAIMGDVNPAATCFNQYGFTSANLQIFYNVLNDVFRRGAVVPSPNPYNPGGTSEGTNEGTGDFDDTSDPIPLPLTSGQYSAIGAGFVNLFIVDQAGMIAFGGWLYNPLSNINPLKAIFGNPVEAVISLGILPFTPSGGTANQPIYLASEDTGATGTRLTSQFETVDCGSIDITEFYGGALDYAPYTNIELVLPYCGTVRLAPEEVMGKTISVEYHVDLLTGACIAFVYDGDRVLSQVPGNVLTTIPYTSGDFRQAYNSILGIAGTAVAGLVTAMTGGMTAPMMAAGGVSLATNVMNMKGQISRGGGCGGTNGYLSVQTPYIVITRPRQCLPDADSEYQGLPLYTYELLGDLSGFTKVRDVHLEGVDCTEAELLEIETLLKEGVIL